jgi:hypothetical protein
MNNFLFNSDHPIDKLVWLYEGEQTLSGGYKEFTIAHNVGAQLFVQGIWSDNDWATTYPFCTQRVSGQTFAFRSTLYSGTSNVVGTILLDGGGSKKIKVRLWGVVHEGETLGLELNPTSVLSTNKFVLNTDNNYPQLLMDGYANPGTTIDHLLNEYPYVDVWYKASWSSGYSYVNDTCSGLGSDNLVYTTTNSLVLGSGAQITKYYYRIYQP